MDFRLSDFLSAADTDDDAIARMLAAGKPHPSRTYHFDVPVTISRVIPLPSDTTVLVKADIRQADGTFDCVFRGANVALDDDDLAFLPPVVEPLRNIRILGVGAGRKIAGPDVNFRIAHPTLGEREAVGDYYGIRTHQIDLSRCDGFEIADLVFEKTRGWCLNFDFCSHGSVHGLRFHSMCKNGDGIDVRTGCHDIELRDIAGDTSDDLLAINASAGPTAAAPSAPYWLWNEGTARMRPSFPARDLDVRRISVRNCRYERVRPNVGCILIVVAKNGSRCTDIDIADVSETSTVPGRINLFLGAFRDSRGTFRPGDIRNVRIVGARSASATNACVTSNVPCADVRVEQCSAGNGVLAELADETGFTFADCTGKVNAYPGYRNLD